MRYVDRGIATRRQKIQCYFHFMQKIFHTQLLSGNSGYAAKMLKIFSALPGRGGYAGFPDPAYLLPKPPPTPLHAMIRFAGHVTLDQSKFSDAPAARWFLVTPKTYNFSQRLRRAGVSGDIMHLMIKLF